MDKGKYANICKYLSINVFPGPGLIRNLPKGDPLTQSRLSVDILWLFFNVAIMLQLLNIGFLLSPFAYVDETHKK